MSDSVVVLSDEQRERLRAVLNRLIPEDDTFLGAGTLGVAEPIERYLAEHAEVRRLFLDGLTSIEIEAERQGAGSFVALDAEIQIAVLRSVESDSPAFFAQLVSQTYRHYYVNPVVVRALGLPADPPQPSGRVLPPFNPALLVHVRARGPIYRKV